MSNPVHNEDVRPNAEEVLQHEEEPARIQPVPVVIEGPVRTMRAPNKTGYIRGINLTQLAAPELIVAADPRRARVQIVARGGVVRLASRIVDFEHGNFFELVNGALSVTIEHTDEIYASTIAASTSVHIIAEYWTD